MVLLEIIGAIVAYGTVKGTCEMIGQAGKKAYPTLDNREFDIQNRRNGLKISTDTDINKIAARCGIRPDKYGVLPEEGYKACVRYVADYGDDTLKFIDQWKKTVEHQKANRKIHIAGDSSAAYNNAVNNWKNKKYVPGKVIMHEVKHWYDLTLAQHQKRVDEIYHNTILGELSAKKPVVKKQTGFDGKRVEVWFIKGTKRDKQDDWLTNSLWKSLYSRCCERCGYKP